jgi:hypothetical protein
MRTRRAGLLDKLIEKVTDNDSQSEFAILLDVSRFSVYKWNLGKDPSFMHQVQINMLCEDVGLKPIYKVRIPKPNGRRES